MDPLFIVGNGSSDDNRSNAVTVLWNGNVGIGALHPQGLLSLQNNNIYLDVDGSNKLTFAESVRGTKTLG